MRNRPLLATCTFLLGLTLFGVAEAAGPISIPNLPPFMFPLNLNRPDVSGKMTFRRFIGRYFAPNAEIPVVGGPCDTSGYRPGQYAEGLTHGCGTSILLNEENSIFHVMYTGERLREGRSFGWSHGQAADWSDIMILRSLREGTRTKSESLAKEDEYLRRLYTTFLEILGASQPRGLKNLRDAEAESLVTNVVAVVGADMYRGAKARQLLSAMPVKSDGGRPPGPSSTPLAEDQLNDLALGSKALLDVVLLAPFHAGQTAFFKYYRGQFSGNSVTQGVGTYSSDPKASVELGRPKGAEITDYWQFSSAKTARWSGLTEASGDAERMGRTITAYESTHDPVTHYDTDQCPEKLAALKKEIPQGSRDVFWGLAEYFDSARFLPARAERIAADFADFIVQVRADADRITAWERAGRPRNPAPSRK